MQLNEITPNTPNPVREDEYYEALAAKLGIPASAIPRTPVWRNEEELAALVQLFTNMQGGSSGGGVLVMHASYNDWDSGEQITLNRTAQEIIDAQISFLILDEDYYDEGDAARDSHVYSIRGIDRALDGSYVELRYATFQSLNPITFYANGFDDFPKTESGDIPG